MKELLAALALVSASAFGGDPNHLLPNKSVTLHDTMSAYAACFAVAKLLGPKVQIHYAATLRTPQITLDFDQVGGARAFDIITSQVNLVWEARSDFLHPGQVLVVVADPPAYSH